jgi:hypothetical protein
VNEGEAIEALANIGELASIFFTLWLSVTFGYLTVAYFLGAALSRLQCWSISVLYVLVALMTGGTAYGYVDGWVQLREREVTILDNVWIFANVDGYLEGTALVLTIASMTSLYFMYDVRKK